MANEKVWTEAQVATAAERFSGRMMQTDHATDRIKLPCGDTCIVLRAGIVAECELAEAVELLRQAHASLDRHVFLANDIAIFLKRNTGGSDGR